MPPAGKDIAAAVPDACSCAAAARAGCSKQRRPKSIGRKLGAHAGVLCAVRLHGAVRSCGQPVFALSVYLHAMTFVFLGMFVASSAGEVLFNKEEADILLHRPVDAAGDVVGENRRAGGSVALAGRARSIWRACSSASAAADAGWLFPIAHASLHRAGGAVLHGHAWCWSISFACAGSDASGWKA